jgi:hypothetical protein
MISKDAVQKTTIIFLLTILTIVLYFPLKIVINSARFFEIGQDIDPGDTSNFNKTGSYKINASTVLESIDHNQESIFMPDTTVLPDLDIHNRTVWTQKEFWKIANSLFETVWKESLDSKWSIHKMSFKTTCKENPAGFEYATFVFYQLILQKGELNYNARAIDISQLDGIVSWGSDSVFARPVFGANTIEMDKLKITADKAFSVAEENGGKAIRQSLQNKCDLFFVLNGTWQVVYEGYDGLPVLEMKIDPLTGEIVASPDQ